MKKTIKLSSVIAASLVTVSLLTGCGPTSTNDTNTTDTTAPTFTSSATATVSTTDTTVLSLTANESATYTITGGANQSLFEIASNVLKFKAAQSTGSFVVDVTATDTAGNATVQTITVTVEATGETVVRAATRVTGADMTQFAWIDDSVKGNVNATGKTNVPVTADISTDTTWTAGNTYAVTGEINVLTGATLTIEPGTIVYGATNQSYLAINKGATLDANGTATNPIVFTSAEDVTGSNSGKTIQGQWGGLTIIGDAPIHGGTKTYEAGTQVGGGSNPADNSGILNYVMIKNSGFAVEVDKELNGLSLLAVGSGTTIENIAVLSSSDDAIEAWGGTVNLTNVYAFDAGDDSLDTDLGYTGTITNAVVKQKNVDKTNYDSSGIETGNDHDTYTSEVNASTIATQATRATYKDITIEAVGGAIYLKNDAGGIFDNVLVTTKASTVAGQADTAGQAMVTHRTTDTVDDLNGTPTGVEILSGGLALVNEVNSSAIYATATAKSVADGGSVDVNQTKDYWEGATGHANITTGVPGTVTGATIADIWKGKAGSNDQ